MNIWEQYIQAAIGAHLRFERRDCDWLFEFDCGLRLNVGTNWRIRNAVGILLTNSDDGQQFGLPAPIDAEATANKLLAGATVESISDESSTGDLVIHLSDGKIIDVITDSSGYESWLAYIEGQPSVIGRNGV